MIINCIIVWDSFQVEIPAESNLGLFSLKRIGNKRWLKYEPPRTL
jgi:hypothetical protein